MSNCTLIYRETTNHLTRKNFKYQRVLNSGSKDEECSMFSRQMGLDRYKGRFDKSNVYVDDRFNGIYNQSRFPCNTEFKLKDKI